MMNYIKKKFFNKEIIITILISGSLWLSLGTKLRINDELFSEINILLENFRYILPFVILILITILRNESVNHKNLKLIILIIFFSYIIGYVNFYFFNTDYANNLIKDKELIITGYIPNKEKDIFFCLYFIVTFFIFIKLNNKEIKIINIINYLFLIIVTLISLYFAYKDFVKNDRYYLYYSEFLINGSIFQVSSLRSLGLARNLVIISIPLIIYIFFLEQKTLIKYLSYLILIIIISQIIQTQSRSANYFLYLFLLIIVFIKFKKKKYRDFIIIFFITIFLPQLLSNSIIWLKLNNIKTNYTEINKDKDYDKQYNYNSRIFSLNPNEVTNKNEIVIDRFSSGRTDLWKKTFDIFLNEKDFKFKILGFGPLSDRYIIKENISNAIIYSLFSGGILGLIGISLLYATTIIEIIRFISLKISIRNELIGYSSIFIIFFLIIRSLFENSFVIFGTDHIFLISLLILLKNKNKIIFNKF